MRTATYIFAAYIVLLLLCFLPYSFSESKGYIELLSYLSVILPLWLTIGKKQFSLVSLLLTSTLCHVVKTTCVQFESLCLESYTTANWDRVTEIITIYSFMHLLFVVALSKQQLDIVLPVLLFTSLLAVFTDLETLFTVVVAAIAVARMMASLSDYYIHDMLGFILSIALSLIFRSVAPDGERRLFQLFYALAFAFSSSVRKTSGEKKHFLMLLNTEESGYSLVNGGRIDLH